MISDEKNLSLREMRSEVVRSFTQNCEFFFALSKQMARECFLFGFFDRLCFPRSKQNIQNTLELDLALSLINYISMNLLRWENSNIVS